MKNNFKKTLSTLVILGFIAVPASAFAGAFGLNIVHRNLADDTDVAQQLVPPTYGDGDTYIPYFQGRGDNGIYNFLNVGSGISVAGGNIAVTVNTIETPDGHLTDTLNLKASTASLASLSSTVSGFSSAISVLNDLNVNLNNNIIGTSTNMRVGQGTSTPIAGLVLNSSWNAIVSGLASATSTLATKFTTPTGTTAQYVRGDGSLATTTVAKRQETYSGTTNGSGVYTVTFGTAYSVAPNVQANIINPTDTQSLRITSISTTGFTVLARNRTDVVGLLPAFSNLSGANVDVLVTEK